MRPQVRKLALRYFRLGARLSQRNFRGIEIAAR